MNGDLTPLLEDTTLAAAEEVFDISNRHSLDHNIKSFTVYRLFISNLCKMLFLLNYNRFMYFLVVYGLLNLLLLLPNGVLNFAFFIVDIFQAHEMLKGITNLNELVFFHMCNRPL